MHDRRIVLLFIKAPVKGRVKTRLAETLGNDAAIDLCRHFILDSVSLLERTRHPFRICYHPPGARNRISNWLGSGHQYQAQAGDDLGERMDHAFRTVFSEGFDRAVLMGSDTPDLPGNLFDHAFDSLETNDAVLGPADDGGYYLIGFTKNSFLPDAFHGIDWSTGNVFSKTLSLLDRATRSVTLLPRWRDVDTADDLKSLVDRNRNTGFRQSNTMMYLASNGQIPADGNGEHMDGKKQAAEILKRLKKEYTSKPSTVLRFSTPLELLVATIMSAQTTDVLVNKITEQLFRKYGSVEEFAKAAPERIAADIKPVNFYNIKARNISRMARILLERFGGRVPQTMEELVTLPGVARKTANIVLSSAFGVNEGIAVDTHVIRLSNRLGLTAHRDPVKIETDLMEITPRKHWNDLAYLLIFHGRAICAARKPKHDKCVLYDICPSRNI